MNANLPSRADLLTSLRNGTLPDVIAEIEYTALGSVGADLASIHNEGAVDIIAYLQGLDWTETARGRSFRLQQLLPSLVGAIKDTAARLIKFLHDLQSKVGKGASYQLNEGFETWCAANPNQLAEILKEIIEREGDSQLLSYVLMAMKVRQPDAALWAAIELSADVRPELRRHAIYLLGRFEHLDGLDADPALRRIIELIETRETADAVAAIGACFILAKRRGRMPDLLGDALQVIAVDAEPAINTALLTGWLSSPNVVASLLHETLTASIARLEIGSPEELGLLNTWLYNADLDLDRRAVFSLLSQVMSRAGDAATFEGLHGFKYRLGDKPNLMGWYAVAWLIEGPHALRELLHELFPPLDQSLYRMSLDGLGLAPTDFPFVARKAFAYLMHSSGPVVSILAALLSAAETGRRRDLEREIAEFWLRNFPNDLKLFQSFDSLYPEYGIKTSIGRMGRISRDYMKPLRKLPRNPALRPSPSERRVQAEIAHERSKDIRKAADEGSIFAQLVSKSTLLYGRASVTYSRLNENEKPVRQVFPLQTFGTEMAVPSMDILAPAHLRYLLYSFRAEPRPR